MKLLTIVMDTMTALTKVNVTLGNQASAAHVLRVTPVTGVR